ncbi:MAG: hypothetical protein MI756_06630 [Chromatiales bacterium]|nr:hypothetical protein [Chromatiales bacterium]
MNPVTNPIDPDTPGTEVVILPGGLAPDPLSLLDRQAFVIFIPFMV